MAKLPLQFQQKPLIFIFDLQSASILFNSHHILSCTTVLQNNFTAIRKLLKVFQDGQS